MSVVDDLERIYIRAQVDGKWGSHSLAELPFETVLDWFSSKLPAGHNDDAHRKAALVWSLEMMGVPIVKLKEGADND